MYSALRIMHFWYLLQCTKCTLHLITYPDVMYKAATAAILIQTRGVQSMFSLENAFFEQNMWLLFILWDRKWLPAMTNFPWQLNDYRIFSVAACCHLKKIFDSYPGCKRCQKIIQICPENTYSARKWFLVGSTVTSDWALLHIFGRCFEHILKAAWSEVTIDSMVKLFGLNITFPLLAELFSSVF